MVTSPTSQTRSIAAVPVSAQAGGAFESKSATTLQTGTSGYVVGTSSSSTTTSLTNTSTLSQSASLEIALDGKETTATSEVPTPSTSDCTPRSTEATSKKKKQTDQRRRKGPDSEYVPQTKAQRDKTIRTRELGLAKKSMDLVRMSQGAIQESITLISNGVDNPTIIRAGHGVLFDFLSSPAMQKRFQKLFISQHYSGFDVSKFGNFDSNLLADCVAEPTTVADWRSKARVLLSQIAMGASVSFVCWSCV